MEIDNEETVERELQFEETSNEFPQIPSSEGIGENTITDESTASENKISNNEDQKLSTCYCGKKRDLNVIEFQCARCLKWFHSQCISVNVGRCLPFMTCYTFLCKSCNPSQVESFTRRQTSKLSFS